MENGALKRHQLNLSYKSFLQHQCEEEGFFSGVNGEKLLQGKSEEQDTDDKPHFTSSSH